MNYKRGAAVLMAAVLGLGTVNVSSFSKVFAEEAPFAETTAQPQTAETNIALRAPARASKSFKPTEANLPERSPNLAVDGISDNTTTEKDNSRWQSGEDATFSEQWLEVDLGARAHVSSINVKFFAKLYGNFTVEVSDSNGEEAKWTELKTVEMQSGDQKDVVKTVDLKQNGQPIEVPRYMRLRFTSGNDQAANRSIAVREFEVMGTKISENGYESKTGNIAKDKRVTASGIENGMPNCKPELVVDGIKDGETSRWSAPAMKTGHDENQKQTPQWLEIDLRNEVTNITSINLHFFKLVYSTDYDIQTRAKKSDEWKTVKHVTSEASGSKQNPVDQITDVKHLDRYVRFVFNKVNHQAGGNGVSIREIEINGTQVQTPDVINPGPADAKEAIDAVQSLEAITPEMTQIPLPQVHDGYSIHVKGSEFPQVVTDEGVISTHNIYDYDMEILLEVTNNEDETDKAEKTFRVHVPNHRGTDAGLYPEVAKQNAEPAVIPSIQEWYGYTGDVALTDDTKIIVLDQAQVNLAAVAEQFQADLKDITGRTVEIVTEGEANGDDFILQSVAVDNYDIGKEGYLLKADDQGVKIESTGYNGVLYGTKTIEQVYTRQNGQYSFPKGVARDFSKYDVRGVMIDIARTPYRLDALEDLLKTFSFYKINEVHFHLNDNRHDGSNGNRGDYEFWAKGQAMFRLESEKFPSLKTDPKPSKYYNEVWGGEPQYTKDEYKDLQRLAQKYGMNPISEIDGPGHSLTFTKYARNHLDELQKVLPEVKGLINNERDWELLSLKGESGKWALDFLKELYDEYLDKNDPTFLGDTVGIGVDEYWGIRQDEQEGMRNYIRTISDFVEASGKKVRMWGSTTQYFDAQGVSAVPYNDIEIDYWSNSWENAVKRSKEGFKIVNVDSFHLYGNPGRDYRDIVNVEHVFNDWEPNVMSSGNLQKADPNLMGAKTALWADVSDMGVTERDNYERLVRQAAILSEKTWGGTDADETFADYSFKYEALKGGPGVSLGSDIPSKTSLVVDYDFDHASNNEVMDASGNGYNGKITNGEFKKEDGKTWLTFNGNGSLETSLRSIDYPYTVQFDVKVSDTSSDMILFDGRDGRLSVRKGGKLGVDRSYFTQTFDTELKPNKAMNITLVGTQQVLKLYTDGKLAQVFDRPHDKQNQSTDLMTTFIFPLTKIGEGLKGGIADVKVYNKALSPEEIKTVSEGKDVTAVNVAQDKVAAGTAQHKGDGNYDTAWKKLNVGWKAIDGDGNTLEGSHDPKYTEKSSHFEGAHPDSNLAVDMLDTYSISKIVLQWDRAPRTFKIQKSADGKNWEDVQTVNGQAVNTVTFAEPINTRYLRMQGVENNGGTFKLREFQAFESVDRTALKEALKKAEDKIKKEGITFEDRKGFDEFYDAYINAQSLNENALALNRDITKAVEQLNSLIDAKAKFTVTFHAESVEPIRVVSGEKIGELLPTAPAKEGYEFKGWFTKKNGKGTQVTENTTVTANMDAYPYYVEVVTPSPSTSPEPSVSPEPTAAPIQPEETDVPEEKPNSTAKPTDNPSSDKKPATGVNSDPLVYAGMMIIAIYAGAYLIKKVH